jgi:hypothetical protein
MEMVGFVEVDAKRGHGYGDARVGDAWARADISHFSDGGATSDVHARNNLSYPTITSHTCDLGRMR